MLFKQVSLAETENGFVSKFTLVLEQRTNKATNSISYGLVFIFLELFFSLLDFEKHIHNIKLTSHKIISKCYPINRLTILSFKILNQNQILEGRGNSRIISLK